MADTVAVVAVVVVLAAVASAAPVASTGGPNAGAAAQETPVNESDVAPGERMAGVVGAEQAAVEGEVAAQAFERRLAVANSSSARADVVGSEVEHLQGRLAELSDREDELHRARENGTLSTGEYRARLARLYAKQRALQRLTNRTGRVARGLPERALRQQGINVTTLRTLRLQARDLTGPEVADIARGIAGEGVGRPAGTGPPAVPGNRTGSPGDGRSGPPDEDERGPPANRRGGPPENETGRSDGGQSDRADNSTGTGSGNQGGAGEGGSGGENGNSDGSGNANGDSRNGADAEEGVWARFGTF